MCTESSFSLQQRWVAGRQITVIKMTNARVGEHILCVYLKAKEQHYVLTASIKGLVVRLGGGYIVILIYSTGYPKFRHDSATIRHKSITDRKCYLGANDIMSNDNN